MVLHYEDQSPLLLSQGLGNLLNPVIQNWKQNREQQQEDILSRNLAQQMNTGEGSLLEKILNTPSGLNLVSRYSDVFKSALNQNPVNAVEQNPLAKTLLEHILKQQSLPDTGSLSDLAALAPLALLSGDPALKNWADLVTKENNEYQKRSFEINKPLYDKIEKSRENLFQHDLALSRIDEAIQSGQMSRWWNSIAKILHLDPLQTAPSQILDSAVKELFLADLGQLSGGRINQFLERTLIKSFPHIGNSPKANLEITQTLKTIQQIKREKIRLFDELQEKYANEGKELPRNTGSIIQKQLDAFATKKIEELQKFRNTLLNDKINSKYTAAYQHAKLHFKNKSKNVAYIFSPQGKVYAIDPKQVSEALQHGGVLLND